MVDYVDEGPFLREDEGFMHRWVGFAGHDRGVGELGIWRSCVVSD